MELKKGPFLVIYFVGQMLVLEIMQMIYSLCSVQIV